MNVKMQIINRDDVEAMAEITMTLGEWTKLSEILKDQEFGNLATFRQRIESTVYKVNKHFYPELGDKEMG